MAPNQADREPETQEGVVQASRPYHDTRPPRRGSAGPDKAESQIAATP